MLTEGSEVEKEQEAAGGNMVITSVVGGLDRTYEIVRNQELEMVERSPEEVSASLDLKDLARCRGGGREGWRRWGGVSISPRG